MHPVAERVGSRKEARAEDVVVAPKGERESGRGGEVSAEVLSSLEASGVHAIFDMGLQGHAQGFRCASRVTKS